MDGEGLEEIFKILGTLGLLLDALALTAVKEVVEIEFLFLVG